MKQQVKVSWQPNEDGSFDVTIKVPAVRLKQSKDLRRWDIISHDAEIPQEIEYCGERKKARLVVRLFSKITGAAYKRICNRREQEELLLRSPLMRQYGRFSGTEEGGILREESEEKVRD